MLVASRFNKKGFTLMELLVIIGIITILIAISMGSFWSINQKAKVAADNANLGILNRATQYCAVMKGKPTIELFPSATTDEEKMDFLILEKVLGGRIEPQQNDVEFIFNGTDGIWYLSNDISGGGSDGKQGVLYESDFDDDSGITLLSGNWTIADGQLIHSANGESRAIFDGTNGSDYDINLRATYLSGASNQSGYGVYYRATNSENITGYCFQFDPGAGKRFTVRKVVNGSEKNPFQSVSMTSVMGSDFKVTDPHDIQISVKGTEHIITVDGIQVLSFEDDDYTEGNVGARTWNNTRVELDNISVRNNN